MRPWTAPPQLQTEAVASSVPPACRHRVHTCDRFSVRIREWAEGEREVAGMLLASHHLVHGGPVLVTREGLDGQGEALGFEGG